MSVLSSFGCGDAASDVMDAASDVLAAAGEVMAAQDAPDAEAVDVASAVPAYAPCAMSARVGLFSIVLAADYTAVEGRVADGVVPANVRVATDSEGDCRLLEGRSLSCEPACRAGETCNDAGACIAYPTAQSVGAVTVVGLSVPLSMQPTSLGAYNSAATSIPHPGFGEGDAITLTALGAVLPGFTLEGRGVAALSVTTDEVVLVRDAALALDWTPGADASARIRMVLDLAHHGGIAASLECDAVADDGHFELPARLVSALLDIGVAGYPTLTVSRRTADSETIAPGCVELAVLSEVTLPVVVPGLTSCSSDEQCTDSQTCQADLTCR